MSYMSTSTVCDLYPPQWAVYFTVFLYIHIMFNDLFIVFDRFLTENALLLKVEGVPNVRYSVCWRTHSPYFCDLPSYK